MIGYMILSFVIGFVAAVIGSFDEEPSAEYAAGIFLTFTVTWPLIAVITLAHGAMMLVGFAVLWVGRHISIGSGE